jgi:hypothetical protein
MKDYIDPYLIKSFCELVSHQLSSVGQFSVALMVALSLIGLLSAGFVELVCKREYVR